MESIAALPPAAVRPRRHAKVAIPEPREQRRRRERCIDARVGRSDEGRKIVECFCRAEHRFPLAIAAFWPSAVQHWALGLQHVQAFHLTNWDAAIGCRIWMQAGLSADALQAAASPASASRNSRLWWNPPPPALVTLTASSC